MTNDQSVNFDDFEVVNERATLWECKQTGSTKDNNLTKLQPSDKSWIMGYYLGCDSGLGQNKTSTAHKIKVVRNGEGKVIVGDKSHLSGNPAETNDLVSLWGSSVLDGKIAENVQPGQLIKITWLGAKTPVKGGKPYHNWEVAINHKVAPLTTAIGGSSNASDFEDEEESPVAPSNAPVAESSPAKSNGLDDFEDDF